MKLYILLFSVMLSLGLYGQQTNPPNKIEWQINTTETLADQGQAQALTWLTDSLYAVQCETCPWLNYWKAFAAYRLAQYHFSDDKSLAKPHVEKAIAILESITVKSSDEHMLLGSLLSLSINFNPGMAAVLSQKARSHFTTAIELDKKNPRAYYGLARNDYYRPKQYGGGTLVEENLLKALGLPFQSSVNHLMPSWGKKESYILLITHYLDEGRRDDAILFHKRAMKEFPDNKELKNIQSRFQP